MFEDEEEIGHPSEYFLNNRPCQILEIILSVISIGLKIVCPKLNLLVEEELIMGFLSVFDLNMLPWIAFIWILGAQLKKIQKYPTWCPPIPVILVLVSFLICALFGFGTVEVNSFAKSLKVVVFYGIGNGCFIALVAMGTYDIAHAFAKSKMWVAIQDMFKKWFKKEEEA